MKLLLPSTEFVIAKLFSLMELTTVAKSYADINKTHDFKTTFSLI